MEEFIIKEESGYCISADLVTVNSIEYLGTYIFHTQEDAQKFIDDVLGSDKTCVIHKI